jgi:hypothetical protein
MCLIMRIKYDSAAITMQPFMKVALIRQQINTYAELFIALSCNVRPLVGKWLVSLVLVSTVTTVTTSSIRLLADIAD